MFIPKTANAVRQNTYQRYIIWKITAVSKLKVVSMIVRYFNWKLDKHTCSEYHFWNVPLQSIIMFKM